ncbi:MAG: SIMPL domain-containing protein [Opitutales bacterium]|nr:SIMPL domain-containing protein [Opitutales bacterium]MCH8541435.1 SIMPL domain-containing protein [Opitutales bacterium]
MKQSKSPALAKRLLPSGLLLTFLLFLPASLLAQFYVPNQGNQTQRPTISVSGEALVEVRPDKAILSFGIETMDQDVQKSISQNREIVRQTIKSLTDLGVKEEKIQTDHISMEPQWHNRHGNNERFNGYRTRNTLVVTIDDPDSIDTVLIAATEAGVSHIHGIDFQTTELRKYRDQARKMALQAAREKAVDMAAVLGQDVGAPRSISEHGSFGWFYSGWGHWGSGRRGTMSQNVASSIASTADGSAEGVAPGQIAIQGRVQVVFYLKDKENETP